MRGRVPMILLLLVSVTSCALLLGKPYRKFERVPGVMGVIYVYSGGTASLQKVYFDKDPTTDGVSEAISMVDKGYFPYLAPAGLVRVLSGPEDNPSCVMVAVTEGSHHWVRVTSKEPRVVELDQATAEKELGGHREISRESLGDATGNFVAKSCPMFGDPPPTVDPATGDTVPLTQ